MISTKSFVVSAFTFVMSFALTEAATIGAPAPNNNVVAIKILDSFIKFPPIL